MTSASAALLAGEVDRLAAHVSDTVDRDLKRMTSAWREGRTREVVEWLDEVRRDESRWRATAPALKARLLRLEASMALEMADDVERAKRLADEARSEAPLENDTRLRAVIAYAESGPEAAVELLAEERDIDALNLRAGLLLEVKRADRAEEARAVLDLSGTDLEPNAETFRVRALSCLASKDLNRAQLEIQKALELGERWESVRFTAATVDYLSSLSPAALPDNGPVPWPEPVDWHLVKRDGESLVRLRAAGRTFEQLAASVEVAEEKRRLETWRLACLANDPDKLQEAHDYCEAILQADPGHYRAVLWAIARGIDVDLSPSETALAELVADGVAEHAHILALTSLYFVSGMMVEAAKLLDDTKHVFREIGADALWTFWRAQASTLAGDAEAAIGLLDRAGQDEDRLREARTLALRALAEKTGDWESLIRHLETSYEETGDADFLAKYCELMAQRQHWSYVADRAEELVDKIGTDEAVRLAAIAAYLSDRFRLCIKLLDKHRNLFVQGKLPDELRRIRALSRSAVGTLPKAVVEAEALAEESPTTPNLVSLAQLYFAQGDLKSLAVISRRLKDAPDLSPEYRLELSRLVQLEDQRLAAALWRETVSQDLPDSLVGMAVSLGFQLNLEEEVGPLVARMAELGNRGEGGVQAVKAANLLSFLEERRKEMAELDELYRKGSAPVHLIAEQANRSLLELYHGRPSANERAPAPTIQPILFVRHGGRGPVPDSDGALVGRRLHLDVTSVLLAAHLEILQPTEEAFGPLRIPADLIPALVLMTEKTSHHQPSKIEEYKQVVELAEAGSLEVVSTELRTDHDARLVEELGEDWVAAFEQARAENGFLLDFLPPVRLGLDGPPMSLPEDAEKRLVNCRSLLEVLRQRGQLSDREYARARSRLGDEGRKEPSSASPEADSILYCDGGMAELLAGAGILWAACGLFRMRVGQRELDGARASLRYHEYARSQVEWLNDLIDRLRGGIEDGTYEVIPAPSRKEEDPKLADSAQLDLICLETLFRFEAEDGDVVWIDDRMANSYPARGSVPIVGVLEVLRALVAAGHLSEDECYDRIERLRAANARFIPLHQDEILYHLRKAQVMETGVLESRPLRTLRRYYAACLSRIEDLQRPPMPEAAPNQFGELEFVVGLNRSASSALPELWKGNEEDYARRVRAEWLLANLYLDLPALARMTWSQTEEEDDRYRLAVELAGLLSQAMQLDWRVHGDESSPRRTYLAWLHERVLSKRFDADPDLISEVAESLKEGFAEIQENIEGEDQARAASLSLRLFLADLPETLQKELGLDAKLMESIGIKHPRVASIGDLSFDPDAFARAATEAVNGREAKIALVEGDEKITFSPLQDQAGTVGLRLALPGDGGDTNITDEILTVLRQSVTEREAVLRRNRRWFDCRDDEFERAVVEIASADDPQRRLDETERWRNTSMAVFYANLHRRLAQQRMFKLPELRPPDAKALSRHLRLHPETGSGGEFRAALDAAADNLIREEGLIVAIERLAGLPVPLPKPVIEAVAAMSPADRCSLFRRLLTAPGSPPSKMQVVRLLSRFAEDTEAYYRLGRRIAARYFSLDGAEEFDAFLSILKWVNDEFDRWPEARSWSHTIRSTMVWAHAHRLFVILVSTGAPFHWLGRTFAQPGDRRMTSEVFERSREYWLDVTHPRRVTREAFLLGGLPYGLGDKAQRFANEASLETADGMQGAQLFRDPTLARNDLSSYLGGDRGERLSSLLGSEQSDLYSRQALRSLVKEKLDRRGGPEQEHLMWASIHAVIGDLPPYEDLVAPLDEAVRQTDFVVLTRKNVQTGILAVHTASQLSLNLGDEGWRSRLKEQLVGIGALFAESDSGAGSEQASVQAFTGNVNFSALVDAALAVCSPGDVHPEFAALVDRLAGAWPATTPFFRLTVLRLCEELPVSQAKNYWPLLVRLRAE
ncbi:hypothetical protein GBA63_18505 [Rubrobacter tropicus]|uniref:Tetratricopeptide repeat protein n=1 Tax=Rubrobacter tropicus TaxID=2653851 RepID=A0A6G8QD93_9ACTN|nr:hypothetical protein GBA63_18505 [Rubrobacter tropicus]